MIKKETNKTNFIYLFESNNNNKKNNKKLINI